MKSLKAFKELEALQNTIGETKGSIQQLQIEKQSVQHSGAGKDPIADCDPQTLCNMISCGNHLMVYQNSNSHGTDMFSDSSLNPSLDRLIISWLDSSY
jgi:hypothetical protein